MVVLSVGLAPNKDAVDLAKTIGVDLNTPACAPDQRPGRSTPPIRGLVCGAFQEPKDIPQSVMEASAASIGGRQRWLRPRGTLTRTKELPPELDVSDQEPRVGVFVCNCGINIGGVADVPAVTRICRAILPHVVHVEDNLFTCSQDTQDKMKEVIRNTASTAWWWPPALPAPMNRCSRRPSGMPA
jgi:heterodisulfide reductase subunit A-like polyferredoxin